MNNTQVAHAFFYQEKTGKSHGKAPSCHFDENSFFSYGTIIGQIVKGKNNNDVLITSYNNHSNTTAKHLNNLRHACPFNYSNIVELPTKRSQSSFYINEQVEKWIDYLNNYSVEDFTKKDNRQEYINIYKTLEKINAVLIDVNFNENIQEKFNMINDETQLKELKKQKREIEKKKHDELKKELAEVIAKNSFSELCDMAWEYNSINQSEYNLKQKLKKYLQPNKDISVIWFNGDNLKTSQSIKVDKVEAIAMMRLYNANKLKHGMTIGYYTVLEVMPTYLKVGCHVIKKENIMELLKEVQADKTKFCEV